MNNKLQTGCQTPEKFCSVKETFRQVKRKSPECEEIFASYTPDRGLILRIYKELEKSEENEQPN